MLWHSSLNGESLLAAKRSEYDDLTNRLRSSNEERLKIERELDPLRQRIVDCQLKEQAARLGFEQYDRFLQEAQADAAQIEASIEADKVRLSGLQSEIDRLQREIQGLGAVNLAALEELGNRPRTQDFLGCAIGGFERRDQHLGRCNSQDRWRNPRTAG